MKGSYDFGVLHAGELGALLGEMPDVTPQRLVGLLTTPSEIPGVPRVHICALDVSHESLDQVGPVVDLVGRKMLQPRACRICEMQRKVANDDGIISRTAQLACQAVVVEPEPGIRLSRVFDEGGGLSKAWGGNGAARISRLNTRVPGGSGDGLLSSLLL